MAAGRDDLDALRARLLDHCRQQAAQHRARLDDRRQVVRGDAQPVEQARRPGRAVRIEHLAGAGDGALADLLPGQPEVEQVGHHQERARARQHFGVFDLLREQLEERVELHELDAGRGEDLVARHAAERLSHAWCRCGCRGSDTAARPAGRCGRAAHSPRPRCRSPGWQARAPQHATAFLQPFLDLHEKPRRIPVQAVAAGAGKMHRPVGEAMDFFERQPLAVEPSDDRPPARRAEVEGEVVARVESWISSCGDGGTRN